VLNCVKYCSDKKDTEFKDKKFFVIGGGEIFKWFNERNLIGLEYITRVYIDSECDVFYHPSTLEYKEEVINVINFEEITQQLKKSKSEKENQNIEPTAIIFKRIYINSEELNLLNLMERILIKGNKRNDRTQVGTRSLFGGELTFDLSNGKFPLMTTRKSFVKGIFEELMLYIRGQTNTKILEDKGVNVWKDNTTRTFLNSRNLQHLPEGDMGHSYGFSMRHFGAKYIDCHTDYTGQGFDQLTWLINEIKTNPFSRRLIISLWEPDRINQAALPPCLFNYQFYIENPDEDNPNSQLTLSCKMTQRSSDVAVAGGWNIATGALFTIMLASVCKLKPKTLIWSLGDVHIYNNLIDQVKTQIKRVPYLYPIINLINPPENIEEFTLENFEIIGYQYHTPIKLIMNA
jgi:thymidylate synthase